MTRDEKGFSLLEILIAIVIMGIIMAMNSQLLQDLIRGQRQQAGVVTSQFETSLGLEMLRSDVSNAGFGLADEFASAPGTYTEATADPAQQFNSAPNIPKALVHNNNVGAFANYIANSDYLVIRSPAVGMNTAAGKWTNITSTTVHIWNDVNLDMVNGRDYMIVIKPRSALGGKSKLIVSSSGAYSVQYITSTLDAAFQPSAAAGERYLAFGIEDSIAPTMPFNRSDYYVKQPAVANVNCAPGTGTLYKAIVKHGPAGTGGATEEFPLVECVANMQVIFRLDTNLDGVPDQTVNDISGLDALTVKEQVKEVQIYILGHEGIMDRGFTYGGANPVTVGPSVAMGTSVNLSAFGTDWNHYRWKTYTLIVKPKSFY
ncbi:MAG: prepilin-type N-terminal cleavage/methylation domain-containing protein [Syntrophorhabdus sp.]|nr:prepilin-type N-terminal cleavage/methylation domain-containing protein [Syntrophorhabdus sp.]